MTNGPASHNGHLGASTSLIDRLIDLQLHVAVAESLTGGQVVAALVDVPGASAAVRGGIVAYATDLKDTLLGVDAELLREVGPVDAQVAAQMAAGVAHRLGAEVAIATTGVAGPGDADGRAAGTVYIAARVENASRVVELCDMYLFTADRAGVRAQTTAAALDLCSRALDDWEHQATEERWGK